MAALGLCFEGYWNYYAAFREDQPPHLGIGAPDDSPYSKQPTRRSPWCAEEDARRLCTVSGTVAAANRQVPIIFITAHGDIPMTVQAMKGGAIEFLTKPFRDQDLLDAVEAGLARDRARRESDRALGTLRERFETLSLRERDVMVQVTAGRLNKQIANDIGIAESTVKVHRTHLMRKMKARSLPELSRMADALKLTAEKH
jgi:DNA-binding NarL/FixJ family response regulator